MTKNKDMFLKEEKNSLLF
jgi:hypothetical protein